MKKALGLSSFALSLALIAGPAAASPQQDVELLPATDLISSGRLLPDGGDLFSPLGDLYEPLLPPAPSDGRSTDIQEPGPGCKVVGKGEREFLDKINRTRARRNRKPVDVDVHISAVSGSHSRAMKREATLRHTGERKLRERVTRWELLGENVGRGGGIDSLHKAFMASPGHREIVLDERFRYVGIGIAQDENQLWITVLFESHIDPGTTMKLPEGC
jgi:Cysteine-rich secretory protein family